MGSMVERVARAICENAGHVNDRHWKHYTIAAKAAIEAMREPTEAMVDAGRNLKHPSHVYIAAIDAALNEQVAG